MFGGHGQWDDSEGSSYTQKEFNFTEEVKHIEYIKISHNADYFYIWIKDNYYDKEVKLKFEKYIEKNKEPVYVAYCKENKTLYIKVN